MAGLVRSTTIAMASAIPLTVLLAWGGQRVFMALASMIPLGILAALVAIWFPRGRRTLAGIYYHAVPSSMDFLWRAMWWPAVILVAWVVFDETQLPRQYRGDLEKQLFSWVMLGWPVVALLKNSIWNNTIKAGWRWAQADWKRQSEFVRATLHLPKDAIYREGGHHALAIDTTNRCIVIIGRCLNVSGMDEDWMYRKIDFQEIDRYGAVRGGHGYDVMFVGGGLQGAVTGLMVGGAAAEAARAQNARDTGIDFTLTDRTHWRVQMPEQLHPHWIRLLQSVL